MVSATAKLRIVGVFCLLIGALQFIFGIKIFAEVGFGSWWAGLSVVVAALIGFCAVSHCVMATALGFSIVAIILAGAGAVVDGIAYNFISQLHACADQDLKAYGDNDYKLAAQACAASNDDWDCACVEENFQQSSDPDCYLFNLRDSDDCDNLLDVPHDLQISFALCLIVLPFILAFSIITCGAVCCPTKCCGYPSKEEEAQASASRGVTLEQPTVTASPFSTNYA